jgi:hypothetical protein
MSDNPTIDPITGLPLSNVVDPITGEPFKNLRQLSTYRHNYAKQPEQINPSTGWAMSTGDFSNYSAYDVPVSPRPFDMEELRARNQGTGEKWARGLGKFGVTAGSSFINTFTGMMGMVDWGIDVVNPYTTADLAKTQAKWARAIDTEKWRDAARESMPHYYTKEELANTGTFGNMFTANFASDKLLDGLGFFVGTAAATYMTGGFSLLGTVGKTAQISRGLAAWKAATTLRSGKSIGKALSAARDTKFWASKIGGKVAYLESTAYMSMGEAALEARETGRMTFEKLKTAAESRKTLAGEDPNLTPQELQQLKLQALEAEGAAFYGNLAVLIPSNALMFRGILRPFNKAGVTSKFLRATTKAERSAGMGNVVDKLAGLPAGVRQVAQAARFTAPLTTRMATEGSEEAAQFAIQEGITDYQLARMQNNGLGELAESLINSNKIKALGEALPEIGNRAYETFSNPDSREQFIIGALVGLIGGGRGAVEEAKAKREMRDVQEKLFNDPNFYKLAAKGEATSAAAEYVKAMERAEKAGDQQLYEYFQKRFQTAQILNHYETGSLDQFRAMMKDAELLEEGEFKKLFEIEESQSIDQKAMIADILENANEIEKSAALIDELHSVTPTRGAARLFMTEEQKQREKEDIADNDTYKFFLKQELGTINLADAAVRAKVAKMKELFPGEDLTIPVKQKDGRTRIVNMENRLLRYARNRFGAVEEGAEEGTEDVLVNAKKLAENLQRLTEQALLAGGIEQAAAFRSEAEDLVAIIKSKDNAATAMRNLLRNPASRDLAMSRAKLVERLARRAKVDEESQGYIRDTVTPEELEGKTEGLRSSYKAQGLTQEQIDRAMQPVETEIRDRKKARSEATDRWNTMSKTAVAAETDLSPLLQKHRAEYLEKRPQEEPLVNTEEEARKRQAERQQQQGQQTPTPTKTADIRPGISTSVSGKEDALLTSVEGQRELVVVQDDKGRTFVVANENGELSTNDIHKERTLNGEPIITNPELLSTQDTAPGAEVEIVVIEDDWWVQNKNNPKYKNEPENIPMYIRVPDKGIVGTLIANNSPLRHTVYNAWKKGGEQAPAIKIRITEKIATNRNNARVEAEQGLIPYMSNVVETLGNVPIGVVGFDRDSVTNRGIRLGNMHKLSDEEKTALSRAAEEAVQRTGEKGVFNLRLGQVVAFHKNPKGEWTYSVLSTAKLTEKEQAKAFERIVNSSDEAVYDDLITLVGLNELEPETMGGLAALYLSVEDKYIDGTSRRMIRFALPEDFVKELSLDEEVSSVVGAIDSEALKMILENPDAAAEILKDKKRAGNLIQSVGKDEEAEGSSYIEFSGVGFDVATKEQLVQLLIGAPEMIEDLLVNKRRQVSIDNLNADPNYLTELANEEHDRGAEDTMFGFKGVISTDLRAHNGSVFHAIGMRFSDKVTVNGKVVDISVPPITVPNAAKPPAQREGPKSLTQLLAEQEEQKTEGEAKPKTLSELIAEREKKQMEKDSSSPEFGAKMSAALRLQNKGVENPTATEIGLEQIAQVQEKSKKIIAPGAENHPGKTQKEKDMYYDTETKTYHPRVSFVVYNGKRITNPKPALAAALAVGKQVDDAFRQYLSGEQVTALDAPGLSETLEAFAQELINNGETVVARNLIVPNVQDNLYGEIDMLTVDEKGVFRVYDLKTMKNAWTETFKSGDNIGQNVYETPFYKDGMSKQTEHSRQLSLYRIGLAKEYGIVAEQATVVGIKPTYKIEDITEGKSPTSIEYIGLRDVPMLDTVSFTIDNVPGHVIFDVNEKREEVDEEQKQKNQDLLNELIEKEGGLGGLLNIQEDPDDPFGATRAIATIGTSYKRMNRNQARKWLRDRNMPVEFYEAAVQIGSLTVHGYFKNGAVHLWHNAEVGTEYHEAFHYTFRILLNDAQREQLYAEARIKYNLPNATNLQLEEEMAEDFRDYVFTVEQSGKGIKGKIIKFFKDLYNYIKILISGKHIGIEQIYSLIESNKIPAKFERNTETLQPKPGDSDMVTRAVSGMDADVDTQAMVIDSVSTVFKNEFDKRKEIESRKPKKMRLRDNEIAAILLGTSENTRGDIAEFFLRHSIAQVDNGALRYVDEEVFRKFITGTPVERGLLAKDPKNRLIKGFPVADATQAFPIEMLKSKTPEDFQAMAKLFYQIWNRWFDVVDERTGNVEKFGFREAVIHDLKRFGINMTTNSLIKETFDIEEEGLVQKEEVNYDKIYAVTHFEQDPIKTVSQEVRRAFSEILNIERNKLGFQTYINVEDALRATLAVAIGSETYEQIVANIQSAAEEFDVLKPIAAYLRENPKAENAAAIRRFLTKEYSEQRIIMEEMLDDDMRVKHVNSDRKSAAIAWVTTWKGESIETTPMDGMRPLALMKENEDKTLSFHNNTLNGKSRLQHLKDAISLYNNAKTFTDKVEALSNLMWYSSLGIATSKSESSRRLAVYFGNMEAADREIAASRLMGKLMTILRGVLEIKTEGGIVKPSAIKAQDNVINPFTKEGSSIKEIAEIAAEFNLPVAIAYVNAMGKTIYPYNLPTPFTELLRELRKGEKGDRYNLMMQDLSMSMEFGDNNASRAMVLYMIEKGEFEIESFALDAVMNEITEETEDYKTMGERNSMIMRINMFLNQGAEYSYIPIPTQETRARIDFLKMPKFTINKSMVEAGIPRSMLKGKGLPGPAVKDFSAQRVILTNVILRDLVRLSLNPNLYKEGKETNFHLSGIENTQMPAGKLSEIVQDAMNAKDRTEYQDFFDEIYRQVDKYMEEVLKPNRNAFIEQLVEYNIIKPKEEGSTVYEIPENSRIDSNGRKDYKDVNTLIASYMFTDLISRIEMAQLFRGGIQNSKSVAEFYKRMGLIQTPGDKFMMKGEFKGNPEYGMNPVLRTATIKDYLITEDIHNEIADRIFRMMRDHLVKKGVGPEQAVQRASDFADLYRPNPDGEYSDGQAWISPKMYSWIEQGLARWKEGKDDEWYEIYKNGGEWAAEYTPAYKFYLEQMMIQSGHMVPNMQKNSYVVLTREFVAGNSALEAMLEFMEEKDVHVVNSLSAMKGYKGQLFNPYNEDNSLKTAEQWISEAVVEEVRGDKLFMPQIINDKQSDESKMNRQIRKTVPSMVNTQSMYTLPDGSEMLGSDILNRYHELHESILDQQANKVFNELGWNKLKADPRNPELRLDFLKRFREMILDNLVKNDKVDLNIDKQLRIIEDLETNTVDFTVPVYFPAYARAFENLIQSLFKSNVYTVKMPGAELVQVAGSGRWNITETDGTVTNRELRHLDIKETTDKDGNITKRELVHSEILISADLAERLNLKVGDTGVAYRIPMQDYSSAVPSRIAGILPEGYSKTIVVAGNIIIQTGSDFDIDKLFALFRNSNEKLTQLQKEKNELLNLIEAVLTNEETMPYLFKPLAQETLNRLADNALYAGKYSAQSVAFDDPLAEIKMESNYKSAATLVGAYANAIAGLNVATRAAQQSLEAEGQGIILNASKHFTLNDRLLNQIQMISPMDGERTLDGVVERLSAALDAATKLIHSAINDNSVTVNATVFLKSIGFPEEDIVALLTTPAVRKFVEIKKNNPNKGIMTVFMESGLDKDKYKLIRDFDIEAGLPVLFTDTLRQITAKNQGFTNGKWASEGAEKAFEAFAHAYVAGNSLSNFYEVIAPDNMDGMGALSEIEAYLDVLDNYEAQGDKNIVGYTEVEKILIGDSYGTMRGFFSTMQEVMELQSSLFITGNQSVRNFKAEFKDITGRAKLRGEDHRFIDRALFYHILTKEGSPLGKYLRKDVVRQMMIDTPAESKGNLFVQVQEIMEDIPALGANRMLAKIIKGPGFEDEVNRVWGIGIENTEKMTNMVRNATIQDFQRLLQTPEIYTQDMENAEEENERIKKLGIRLVLNSIITTGLAPSFGSYYSSIPIEFFLEIKDENGKSLMEYMRQEFEKVRFDEAYFDDFMFDFIQNYGTTKVAGIPLISRVVGFKNPTKDGDALTLVPGKNFDITEREVPLYATFRQGRKGVDKISVYEFDADKGVYHKIHSLGIGGKVLEMNLRDANGEIVRTSFWADKGPGQGRFVKIKVPGKKPKTVRMESRIGLRRSQISRPKKTRAPQRPSKNNNLDQKCD